jgi:hypothetical protein
MLPSSSELYAQLSIEDDLENDDLEEDDPEEDGLPSEEDDEDGIALQLTLCDFRQGLGVMKHHLRRSLSCLRLA